MAVGGLQSDGGWGASALEAFRVQARVLAAAGVDLLVLEMMVTEAVAEPALQAASETGLPVWFGLGLVALPDRGELGAETVSLIELAQGRADALMLMHTDIDVVDQALPLAAQRWPGRLGAYPHVGDWTPPNWVFHEISPAEFAARVAPWAAQRAQVLGGCCGIGPAHIDALRRALPAGRA
jgi:S-methylmethionine-dependent homocysteine/selenocysteine methylase